MDSFEGISEDCLSHEEEEWAILPDHHQRTILHIDIDCFYAQVEMVRNPSLRDKPLGIKQKNLMVTCNYVARSLGVKKSMWIKEAIEVLPDMVFVDGSDLTHYRQFSAEISGVAQTFTPHVERLGMDENFVDLTDVVGDYLPLQSSEIEGHTFGDKEAEQVDLRDPCGCGCRERLIVGSHIAKELRQQILETTGITCCAGIAHNKLLAKLVSGYYKPNQQTVLFPWQVYDVMNSLNLTKSIPGIGSVTHRTLEDLGILTVQQLQNTTISLLKSKFENETSQRLKNLSFGIDETPVRKCGRPQSIGLEDAFRKVTSIEEIKSKYSILLERLLKLLADDGRIPASVKVSVRKFDKAKKFGHRETRQASISSSLFSMGVRNVNVSTKLSLMTIIMGLFHKMVDTNKDFHLTLVAVGFNKFIERASYDKSISKFFSKCIQEETAEPDTDPGEEGYKKCHKLSLLAAAECPELNSCMNNGEDRSISHSSDDAEVSVKNILSETCMYSEESKNKDGSKIMKAVMENANADNNYFISSENGCEKSFHVCDNETGLLSSSEKDTSFKLPSGIDKEVFNALPNELQEEILLNYKNTDLKRRKVLKTRQSPMKYDSSKNKKIDHYFKPKLRTDLPKPNVFYERTNSKVFQEKGSNLDATNKDLKGSEPTCSYTVTKSPQTLEHEVYNTKVNLDDPCGPPMEESASLNTHLPSEIDPTVFNALPDYMQQEILQEHSLLKQMSNSVQPKKTQTSNRNTDGSSILKYLKKM